jgi:hypothetical protein
LADPQGQLEQRERTCPKCGSAHTTFVQRGLAGVSDEHDQYFVCAECSQVTYEILSRTERQLRMERLEPGRSFKLRGLEYAVVRVLKAGLIENLVYVRPIAVDERARRTR